MNSQPNIVFILADDLGAWALGCTGSEEIQTPNLDRLAKEGLLFENFFCASPVCSPARASLLTGSIPSYHGVHDWIRSGNVDKEQFAEQGKQNPYGGYTDEEKPIQYLEGLPTYTDLLAEQGYLCALSGKWHLGDSLTPQHGFSKEHWYTIGKGGAFYYYPDIVEDGTIEVKNGEYITDLITDKAVAYLDSFAKTPQPFYLSVHYTAPHSPWEPEQHPKEYIQLYENNSFASLPNEPDHPESTVGPVYGTPAREMNLAGYAAAISAMDAGIGAILRQLEETGQREQTIVVFTADNGMNMGHHGIWGKGNGTFPQNMYDTSVKVPFLISLPENLTKAKKGSKVTRLTSAYDWFPTVLDLAGISQPKELSLPGSSFALALQGEESKMPPSVVVFDEYGPVRMIRTEQDKYVHRYPYGPHEYYDLQSDPDEEHNRIADPTVAPRILALRQQLRGWFDQYMNPERDGSKEAVSGLGQLDLAGKGSNHINSYYPR